MGNTANQTSTGTRIGEPGGGYMTPGTAPNVSNLVGQAGGLRTNINAALNAPTGATDAPDITSLIRNVNTMGATRNAALTAPGMGTAPSSQFGPTNTGRPK